MASDMDPQPVRPLCAAVDRLGGQLRVKNGRPGRIQTAPRASPGAPNRGAGRLEVTTSGLSRLIRAAYIPAAGPS